MSNKYVSTSDRITYTWKTDPSAGNIPAHVHYDAKEKSSHPIAIMYHIGGFVMGSTDLIAKNQVDYLVSKGFVVVLPEYRLAPQVDIVKGPIQDAKEVYLWAQEKLPTLLKESTGIEADSKRMVSIGYSAGAFLALATGTLPNPPLAIIDFYGVKYLDDEVYKQPLAAFAQMPVLPDEFLNKVYDGAIRITAEPMFVDGKPALNDPRAAWYIAQLKNGTSISSIVPNGNYDFEISRHFGGKFPPTFFLHGTPDIFVPSRLAVQANETLKNAGNESQLLLGDDFPHVFDLELDSSDPKFTKYVVPALDFAVSHVQ